MTSLYTLTSNRTELQVNVLKRSNQFIFLKNCDEDSRFVGLVHYSVSVGGPVSDSISLTCVVDLFDKKGNLLNQTKLTANAGVSDLNGTIEVPNAKLWWPYLMHSDPGYMYTLQVKYEFYILH